LLVGSNNVQFFNYILYFIFKFTYYMNCEYFAWIVDSFNKNNNKNQTDYYVKISNTYA